VYSAQRSVAGTFMNGHRSFGHAVHYEYNITRRALWHIRRSDPDATSRLCKSIDGVVGIGIGVV